MTSTANFRLAPPPQHIAFMEKDDNGNVGWRPNPVMEQWITQLFNWTKNIGNNATSSIGGFQIGADYIRDVANSFGLASTVTGGDDVRFWAGATFANRSTAPARITEAGVATFSSGTVGGWTMGTTTLSGGNALLTNTGVIQLGTANDVAILTAADANYRLWIGNAAVGSSMFSVTKAGFMTASGATFFNTSAPLSAITASSAAGTAAVIAADSSVGGLVGTFTSTYSSAGITAVLGTVTPNSGFATYGIHGNSNSNVSGGVGSTQSAGVKGVGANGAYGVLSIGPMYSTGAVTFASTLNVTGAITASSTINGTTIPTSKTLLDTTSTSSALTSFGASIALGTPASGTLTNCTFPTLNQNTTGSAGSLLSGGHTFVQLIGVAGGTATATFSSTTKPGSNTSSAWASTVIDGTTYYIPIWQ